MALTEYAVEPGEGPWVNVWLRWKAMQDIAGDYAVSVQLLDQSGRLVAQHDGIPVADQVPTQGLREGQVVDDLHSIPLPTEMSPGALDLVVVLYSRLIGTRLQASSGGDAAVLERVNLTAPEDQRCLPPK
jgi:hypothetical protein